MKVIVTRSDRITVLEVADEHWAAVLDLAAKHFEDRERMALAVAPQQKRKRK